ncbi:hypothetical protein [Actinoplanes sp. N902-109]|uniref:hypothetical protein n=1 Tax=Actinoplanes sp. (strain N902-109) TaxID=649831 RepID=UPI0003293AED|nr:hypothetical protein [Actinoplanes sp. N902-109]AGL16867.1 hypothetical protein L083_3357 [Actinoplanes sp. N902-109]
MTHFNYGVVTITATQQADSMLTVSIVGDLNAMNGSDLQRETASVFIDHLTLLHLDLTCAESRYSSVPRQISDAWLAGVNAGFPTVMTGRADIIANALAQANLRLSLLTRTDHGDEDAGDFEARCDPGD